ncbi:MAG: DUF4160 domain-containing protein [Ignavibacteria bacterium]|nr:DUF4160 domain-containing protein [Ignavibacteria bacterium]MCC7159671.1 DUF4160 domain-containing protein [Ignavibacteria bacterium]
MGKLVIFAKYVLFVFSSDINEKRKHVHVRDKSGKIARLCKFWIKPNLEIAYNYGFNETEINEIKKLISNNLELINKQLDKFYAGKKVKSINA